MVILFNFFLYLRHVENCPNLVNTILQMPPHKAQHAKTAPQTNSILAPRTKRRTTGDQDENRTPLDQKRDCSQCYRRGQHALAARQPHPSRGDGRRCHATSIGLQNHLDGRSLRRPKPAPKPAPNMRQHDKRGRVIPAPLSKPHPIRYQIRATGQIQTPMACRSPNR